MRCPDKVELFVQLAGITGKNEALPTNFHENIANLFSNSPVFFHKKKTAMTFHKKIKFSNKEIFLRAKEIFKKSLIFCGGPNKLT